MSITRRPAARLAVAATAVTAGVAVGLVVAAVPVASAAGAAPPARAVGPAVVRTSTPPIPAGWPAVSSASQTAPIRIAPGVSAYSETYRTADGPEHTQVISLDLTRRAIVLDTVESHDHVIDPSDELTTSMGDRTGAEAGINGDYFDIHVSGAPLGGVVRDGALIKSPRVHYQAQLAVDRDGTVHIGEVDFRGTLRAGRTTTPLASVNTAPDAATGAITELTPAEGADTGLPAATLVIGRRVAGGLVVQEVRASVTSVPALAPGQLALLGGGAGGRWLVAHAPVGARVTVSRSLSDPHVQALLSGATVLVRDGAVYDDPTGTPPSGRNPETMVGVSRDHRHVLLVVIDGRQAGSIGVTPTEAAEYLVAHGADSGILLDGGGSSTIAARLPGTASLSILNSPSDATGERPVANGLFVYRG